MEYYPSTLTTAESNVMVDRIEDRFGADLGLWAVEVPGRAAFIGYVGLAPADPQSASAYNFLDASSTRSYGLPSCERGDLPVRIASASTSARWSADPPRHSTRKSVASSLVASPRAWRRA